MEKNRISVVIYFREGICVYLKSPTLGNGCHDMVIYLIYITELLAGVFEGLKI